MSFAHPLSKTYCNPIPLPDYPRGVLTVDKANSHEIHWQHAERRDYRETADPSVIYHEGKWYLYPSAAMAFVTEDFVNWTYHEVTPHVGYAPTIVKHRGWFYLTACETQVLRAKHPLGRFEVVGPMCDQNGKEIVPWIDPMLFSDDDGRLYAYWGIGLPGIWGAEVDPEKGNQLITEQKILMKFNPEHVWERFGDYNEDASQSYPEGPWLLKERGTYFLTYAAPGTEFRSYGMGCYTSKSPLGPFEYQKRNPILRDTEGLVNGPGHGCLVRGPNETLWAFYTCLVRNEHAFERRVGFDPAGFDAEGNLFVLGASEVPQWAPGLVRSPELGNDAGLVPVSINKRIKCSSYSPGRTATYAIDNNMRTWWQPALDDKEPWIEIDLRAAFDISAVRIIWSEEGLNYDAGATPGPVQYKLEGMLSAKEGWKMLVDRTQSTHDWLIDYQTFQTMRAYKLRLTITGHPKGINTGVLNITGFGKSL